MRIKAHKLMGGRGQGPAMVSTNTISFLGGIGSTTGEVLDPNSNLSGANVSGHVLVFPGGKGSTVGSYVLYSLARRGRAPAAMIVEKPDTIVTVGAVIGSVPTVYGIPPDAIVNGEWIEVDGDKGTIRVRDIIAREVVTCFLRNRGEVLILKRSKRVGTFKGAWAGVSGFVEGHDVPLESAIKEIEEETAIKEAKLISTGQPIYAREGSHLFVVHSFLFDVDTRRVKLDWEHTDYRWIDPAQIKKCSTVPKLFEAYVSAINGRPTRHRVSSKGKKR